MKIHSKSVLKWPVLSGNHIHCPKIWLIESLIRLCTKTECQNVPGYPNMEKWHFNTPPFPSEMKSCHFEVGLQEVPLYLLLPPPQKKSGHFRSNFRLQICNVLLYCPIPRCQGDLKMYHLLSG